jgi:phosphoglycolate phosphatase
LKTLTKAKKKLFIVSSKPTDEAKKIVDHHKLDDYFEAIVGCKIDLSNSEKAELIGEALGYYPQETKKSFVMVGDRKYDILGTKPHDIDSIGVTYGFGTITELRRAKPTYLAQTIDDLRSYL